MRLHYAEVLNPRKVCALAKYVGAPVAYVHVDLAKGTHRTPAYRALNPNLKVPVLEDGDQVFWESDAILCHLARSTGSDTWPTDSRQVDIIRWLSWNQTHFQPLGGTFYFEYVIKAKFGIGPPNEVEIEAAKRPFKTFARILDDHLSERDWLVGKTPTIADFTVSSALPYAAEAKLPLEDCPAIARWHKRLDAIEAWRNPYPDLRPGEAH